jgi:hypothetical protein
MKVNKIAILLLTAAGVGYYLYSQRNKKATPAEKEEGSSGGGGGGFMPIIPKDNILPVPTKVPFICPTHPDPRKTYICSGSKVIGETMKTGTSAPAGGATGSSSGPSQSIDRNKLKNIQSTSTNPLIETGSSIGTGGGFTQTGIGFSGKSPLTIENLLS